MNLVFYDRIKWDFDAESPFLRPLGGSQSALCYLALALAQRSHAVVMYTGTSRPRSFRGVQCNSHTALTRHTLANCDAFVVLNGPAEVCIPLRPHLSPNCRLILWTGHAADQPAMAGLKRPEIRAGWDAIVCVSQWHANQMTSHFDLDPTRVKILRNAIGPAFENLFDDPSQIESAKLSPPKLAYNSTPYRGLDLLLQIFPTIHRRDPRVALRVYSSMKVYFGDHSDPYEAPYAACKSTPGVDYVGAIPQPQLAAAMKSDLILAYSNKVYETSCIAVMEAMAAGLLVVTNNLARCRKQPWAARSSFPDRGMAKTFPLTSGPIQKPWKNPSPPGRPIRNNSPRPAGSRWREINQQCTWSIRAGEWEQFLSNPSN